MTARGAIVLCGLCACGPRTEPGITVLATAKLDPLAAASLEFLPTDALRHEIVSDPAAELQHRGGFVIALMERDDCTQCYRLEGDAHRITVKGGAPLGVQYGLAHALELFGYGFFTRGNRTCRALPRRRT
jgi:hypothetical protein